MKIHCVRYNLTLPIGSLNCITLSWKTSWIVWSEFSYIYLYIWMWWTGSHHIFKTNCDDFKIETFFHGNNSTTLWTGNRITATAHFDLVHVCYCLILCVFFWLPKHLNQIIVFGNNIYESFWCMCYFVQFFVSHTTSTICCKHTLRIQLVGGVYKFPQRFIVFVI